MCEDVSGRSLSIGDYVFIIMPSEQYHDLTVSARSMTSTKQSKVITINKTADEQAIIDGGSLPKICDGVILGFNDGEVLAKVTTKEIIKQASSSEDIILQVPSYFISRIGSEDSMDDVMESLENDIENWNMRREAVLLSSMLNIQE